MPGTRKLGKTTDQRKAMLRQQVTDLLDMGRMETTVFRAKEIAPLAEKMITLGKKKDMAAYRQALSFITRETVAHKLYSFKSRNKTSCFIRFVFRMFLISADKVTPIVYKSAILG